MGQITGIVKLLTEPIAGKTVRLYYRDTGILFAETTSAVDGTFSFTGVPSDIRFTAIAISDDEHYNHGIDDGLYHSSALDCDLYKNFVSIHLPCTGANNGTSFTSTSIYNTVFTSNGAVTKTDNYKFSDSSGFFSGSTYLSNGNSGLLHLTDKNFTIEAWAYITSNLTSSYHVIISQRAGFNSNHNLTFLVNGPDVGGKLQFQWGNTSGSSGSIIVQDPDVFPVLTWVHVAVTRENNTIRLFKNGNLVSSTTITGSFFTSSSPIEIGRISTGYYYGYIQDFRVTKNIARYVSAFTPPSELMHTVDCGTDPVFDTNVVLYLKGNGTEGSTSILDSSILSLSATTADAGIIISADSLSSNGFAIKTRSDINNAIYFSYSNFANSNEDFTIEGWVKIISQTGVGDGYVDGRGSFLRLLSGGASGTRIIELAGAISLGSTSQLFSLPAATTVTVTSYLDRFYFAVTRISGTTKVWFNGVLHSTTGITSSAIDTIRIGTNPNSAGRRTSVFLDEIRFTKGIARYDGSFPTSFTIPNSPLNTN